eukprot:765008-Hanusia_phi.AAC.3
MKGWKGQQGAGRETGDRHDGETLTSEFCILLISSKRLCLSLSIVQAATCVHQSTHHPKL